MLAKYRVTVTIAVLLLIMATGIAAIFWARGFKPDFKNGKIERTGLIVATSIPTGAQVYLDDRLTSATNTNIAFLDPKTYKVRIEKDGYTVWEKQIEIKADLATEIKALLFPLAPEIKPLTTTGATNPTLSPDGGQIVYGVPGQRGGVYVISMADRPFPFRQEVRQLAQNRTARDFASASFLWSPDSKQIIARLQDEKGQITANLLLDIEKTNQEPNDVTASMTATRESWQDQLDTQTQTLAIPVPDEIKAATAEAQTSLQFTVNSSQTEKSSSSVNREPITLNYYPTGLIFSPDEEKVLYLDKNKRYHVYDLKVKKDFTLPEFEDFINISWYPDSNHLVIAQNPPSSGVISIIEIDGSNKMTVYSGVFENGFVFAHPSGTRLIILTTLTQPKGNPANLYSINLR